MALGRVRGRAPSIHCPTVAMAQSSHAAEPVGPSCRGRAILSG
jgi:hypothetical protein